MQKFTEPFDSMVFQEGFNSSNTENDIPVDWALRVSHEYIFPAKQFDYGESNFKHLWIENNNTWWGSTKSKN